MFIAVWRFRVRSGQEHAFESGYKGDGDWAQLFRRAPGYIGTELLRAANEREYLTIDRWESAAAFEAFKQNFGAEYAQLDEKCGAMTEHEQSLGQFTIVA